MSRGAAKVSSNKKIVSIVDDEIDIQRLFQDALLTRMEGASVVSFNSSDLALDHYIKNKDNYALVIADYKMPQMDGLELLKRVKKLNSKVRTMLISAYEFRINPIFDKYVKQGIIDSYYDKPMTIDGLCQRVSEEFRVSQLRYNESND